MSSNYIASSKKSETGAVRQHENIIELLATHDSLRGFAVITFQNAAEFGFASDSAFRLRNEVLIQNCVVSANAAMGPFFVIMFQPHAKNIIELSSTETNKMIQHFPFCSSDEALTECVRHRSTRRNFYRPDFGIFPKHVESIRILSIAIPNEKLGLYTFIFHPHRGIPCLLHYPSGIRMIGARTAIDFSATQMNEYENIGVAYPAERENSFRKEIARHNAFNMSVDKGRPGNRRSLSSFLGIGKVALPFKDVSDGGCSDTDTQLFEFSKDATVSPAEILPGESQNQIARGLGNSRSSGPLARSLISGLPKPSTIGLRLDDLHDVSDVVVHHCTQPEEFRLLFGSGDDAAGIDPISQHSHLGLENAELGVVPWPEVLGNEHQNRENETIHTRSFRMRKNSKRPDTEGYTTGPIFSNPLNWDRIPSRRPNSGLGPKARQNPSPGGRSDFPVNSLLLWKGN